MDNFPFTHKDSVAVRQQGDTVILKKELFGYMMTEDMFSGLKELINSYPKENVEMGEDFIKIKKAKWL